jgi:transposase InsO family protein
MPYVFPYIDNIVFASKDWEEHEMHAKAIIDRLTSVALTIKPTSVNLGNSEIRILGHLITKDGIGLDPEKKRLILDWPLPKTGAQLASFLGLGTYLRDHVRHYADLTAKLETIKKQKTIEWTDELKNEFLLVKRAFSTAPFLRFPNFNKRFAIATDASWIGIGAVLYQPDEEGGDITPWNIVAICSKKLSPTQQRYPVYKKELWAVVYALRKFHSYIWGRPDTLIFTDHKPLIHIFNQTNLSAALQQWLDVIMGYNLKIIYRPGILHILPDALSRMYTSVYKEPEKVWGTIKSIEFVEDSFKNLSPSDLFCEQSIQQMLKSTTIKKKHEIQKSGEGKVGSIEIVEEQISDLDLLYSPEKYYQQDIIDDDIQGFTDEDEWEFEESMQVGCMFESARLAPMYTQEVQEKGMLSNADEHIKNQENDQFEKNAQVFEKNHVKDMYTKLTDLEKLALAQEKRDCVIPPIHERNEIIQKVHERGHFGMKAIFRDITNRKIWWPHIMNDIAQVVKNCRACQEYTICSRGYHPLQSIHASQPGDHWMIDLIEMIESTDGMNYILNVVDVFTGFVMLYAIPTKDPDEIARKLWEMICIFGPPKIIQSDQGGEFCNAIIDSLLKHEGISHRVITAYHPQGDGMVERSNSTIRTTINKLVRGMHIHWPLYLPFAQLSYNAKVHELKLSTPHALMFARKMNEFQDYTQVKQEDYKVKLEEWEKHQDEVLSLIYPQIALRAKQVHEKFAQKLEKLRRNILTRDLPPGTQVMILDEKYIKSPHMRPKTDPKYIGKYTIVKREVNGPYVLKDMDGQVYPRKVPIDQMKVLFKSIPGYIPAMSDDKDVWQVECLVNDMKKPGDNRTWYEVKWKGFDSKDNTWEPEEHINDQNLIDKYWRKKSGMKLARQVSNKRNTNSVALYFMTSKRDTLFNEADQTAQTTDNSIKTKFQLMCADMDKII